MSVFNALTIDVEEWYHVCGVTHTPDAPPERRARLAVDVILTILEQAGVKATFFVLGCLAEDQPDLVPAIAAQGHEIASHGWSHRLVHELSPEEFRTEVRRTARLLEQQGGVRPVGFRAPQWSLSPTTTPWAYRILREEGCTYDSSMNPLPFLGNPGGKLHPFPIATAAGELIEMPPLVLPTPLCNLPVGGGWGFRFFSLMMIRSAIRRMNRKGSPAVLYLHPREVDPAGPRLPLPPVKGFATYGTRADAAGRLRELCAQFPFAPLDRLVGQWHTA